MIVEKILWIDTNTSSIISGTTNNFTYDINNAFNFNYKSLSVELIDAIVNKNFGAIEFVATLTTYPVPFNSRCIKILIDFGVGSNCIYNYGLLMGVIANNLVEVTYPTDDTDAISLVKVNSNTCEKLEGSGIKYLLNSFPNGEINIKVYSDANIILVDTNGNAPNSVLLCLGFTYEI